MSILFFPHFLAIFTSVTILRNVHRPCNQCIKIIKRVYSYLFFFFLMFLDLHIIFAWITILGNAHRPCKQYTNIVEDGLHEATPFISDVLGIFASITILGNVHRPCKHYLNLLNNSLHHVYSFFPDFSRYSYYIWMNYHIRKCAQNM